MERVVNIYADGRLAYTGFLSLAAFRFNMTERALSFSIDNGLCLPAQRQPRLYRTEDGVWPVPVARNYTVQWRDA